MTEIQKRLAIDKSIEDYCKMNEIEDVTEFRYKCLQQGFNIVRFGISPKDNINREHNGIQDLNYEKTFEEDIRQENERKQNCEETDKGDRKPSIEDCEQKEEKEFKPKKSKIEVRKIQIVKK